MDIDSFAACARDRRQPDDESRVAVGRDANVEAREDQPSWAVDGRQGGQAGAKNT